MASSEHTNVKEKEEAKSTPRDARAMKMLLKEMGVEEYEPRVINQMLEFTYRQLKLYLFSKILRQFTVYVQFSIQ